jgi:hypothetical protein
VLALLIAGFARDAYAYIDPGILTVLYQIGYVALFGALTTVVFTPYRFIKALLQKLSGRRPEPPAADDASSRIVR